MPNLVKEDPESALLDQCFELKSVCNPALVNHNYYCFILVSRDLNNIIAFYRLLALIKRGIKSPGQRKGVKSVSGYSNLKRC